MRVRLLLVAVVGLSLVGSGCVGSDAKPASTSSSSVAPAPVPTVSADTGSIKGTVSDPEQQPVAAAQVGLLELNNQTTTSDEAGQFTFNGLAPGSYQIVAQKLGYESNGKKIQVEAGKVAEVRLLLTPLAVNEAYTQPVTLNGFFSSGIAVHGVVTVRPGAVFYLLGTGTEQSIFDTNVTKGTEKNLKSVVDSMVWTPTAPGTGNIFQLDLKVDGATKNTTVHKSPMTNRIDDFTVKKSGMINHWVWLGTAGTDDPTNYATFTVSQKFTIYSTFFFGEPAPEGFTGLPG